MMLRSGRLFGYETGLLSCGLSFAGIQNVNCLSQGRACDLRGFWIHLQLLLWSLRLFVRLFIAWRRGEGL